MNVLRANDVVETACRELGYDLAALIAATSIWVNPAVYRMIEPVGGVWHPDRRRANLGLRRKGEQLERVGDVIEGITLDNNTYANTCFKRALGVERTAFEGFHICHVWPGTAYDASCYTNIANLVAIPAELSSLTDHHPRIVASLKFRSWELYGWKPTAELAPVKPEGYPVTWREPMEANEEAMRAAKKRAGVRGGAPVVHSSAPVDRVEISDADREFVLIAALYLSKFGHEHLGLGNQDQTFARVAERLHVKKTTLRNQRDRFDPHTGSGRRGWWQAGLPQDVAGVLRDYGKLSESELRAKVAAGMRRS